MSRVTPAGRPPNPTPVDEFDALESAARTTALLRKKQQSKQQVVSNGVQQANVNASAATLPQRQPTLTTKPPPPPAAPITQQQTPAIITNNNNHTKQYDIPEEKQQYISPVTKSPAVTDGYDDEPFDDYDADEFDTFTAEPATIKPITISTHLTQPTPEQPVVSPVKSILKKQPQSSPTPIPPTTTTIHPARPAARKSNIVSFTHQWPVRRPHTDTLHRTALRQKHQRALRILQSVALTVESFDIRCEQYTAIQLYHEALHTKPCQLVERHVQTHHDGCMHDEKPHDCTTQLCRLDGDVQCDNITHADANTQCLGGDIDYDIMRIPAGQHIVNHTNKSTAVQRSTDQAVFNANHARLDQFISIAGALCDALLAETATHNTADADDIQESINATAISSVCSRTSLHAGLSGTGRTVTAVQFSPNSANLLYIAYSPVQNAENDTASAAMTLEDMLTQSLKQPSVNMCSIVVCYDVAVRNSVVQSYVSSNTITSIDILHNGTSADTYIMCGCADGCIVAYNAQSATATMHANGIKLIQPSCTTCMQYTHNHHSSVVKIQCISSASSARNSDLKDVNDILSSHSSVDRHMFTLVSMDDMGTVMMWRHEATKHKRNADVNDETTTDPYRLTKLRTVHKSGVSQAFGLCVPLLSKTQCLTAMSNQVRRLSLIEKMYLTPSSYTHGLNSSDVCTALSVSCLNTDLFAAGYCSGAVAIYTMDATQPLNVWSAEEDTQYIDLRAEHQHPYACSVMSVTWSATRPGILYVLDVNGAMRVLDVTHSLVESVECMLMQRINNNGCVAVSSCGQSSSKQAYLALQVNGHAVVEVHRLTSEYGVCRQDEFEHVNRLLGLN